MAWTYSGNPANSALDQVRFVIGDTDSANQLLSNAEIDWLISARGNASLAAPNAAEAIAAKLAHESDSSKSVGDLSLSLSLSARSQKFYDLADRLIAQAGNYAPPILNEAGTALGAEFSVGQMDYIGTGIAGTGITGCP